MLQLDLTLLLDSAQKINQIYTSYFARSPSLRLEYSVLYVKLTETPSLRF